MADIRRVTADDWELFREIRLRALADSPDAFGITREYAERHTPAGWRERAGGPGVTLIALEDDSPVAMGGAFPLSGGGDATEPRAMIWGMWTAPEARGRGLGARILAALLAWCRAERFRVLLHVTEGNDQARRLYVTAGFRPTGHWQPLRDGSELRVEEMELVRAAIRRMGEG